MISPRQAHDSPGFANKKRELNMVMKGYQKIRKNLNVDGTLPQFYDALIARGIRFVISSAFHRNLDIRCHARGRRHQINNNIHEHIYKPGSFLPAFKYHLQKQVNKCSSLFARLALIIISFDKFLVWDY